jgi:glucose/mannose-6-phosphate isomerase
MAERELPFPEGYYPFDKSDFKKILDEFPNQVREGRALGEKLSIEKTNDIYWFGMGGSAIAGELLRTYLFRSGISITTIRGYDLPENIPPHALLIFSSYSGNTEESLSCYKQACRAYKNIISISAGGKLEEMAKSNRTPHISLPKGLPPRITGGYFFFAFLALFDKTGMTKSYEETQAFLKNLDLKKIANMGVDISAHLKDQIPLIYASNRYYPVAYRWKADINENAKCMAFSNEFPELNHNEIVGYTFIRGSFYGIILKFDDDHRRIQKRMELMKAIMKKSGVEVTEIALKGNTITKMFTALLIGHYTAYFLALRHRIDPTPVKLVEKFKNDMGPFV